MTIWIFSLIVCMLCFTPVEGWTVGDPLCYKDSTTGMLTSQFNIRKLVSEDLSDIFGCIVNNSNNGLLERVECNVTNTRTVTENGVQVQYLEISSKVNLTDSSITINGCGITETVVSGQRTFQKIVGLRQTAGFIKENDANYQWSCVEQSATNLFISTSIEVLTPSLTNDLTPISPMLMLTVLKKTTPGNTFQSTSNCTLGDELKLQVTMEIPPNYVDHIKPWGLSLFTTRYGPTAMSVTTASNSYLITGSDGCIISNSLDFMEPFSRQPSTPIRAVYETGIGECRRLPNTNELWFSTYAHFCFGQYEVDQKCLNFCTFSTSNGRKKRQDQLGAQKAYVKLTVLDEQTVSAPDNESLKPLMIGLTVGVMTLLFVVLAIAVYVCCISRNRNAKRRFINSSTTSSTLSIPTKF